MKLISTLNWRYATKRMTEQKVEEKNLHTILEAIRLSPSAYGLQPYKVIITENKSLLHTIFEKSCPQVIIQQCSHLLIFKAKKELDSNYVEHYLSAMQVARNVSDEYVDNYRNKINNNVINNPTINTEHWIAKQVYIALGFGMIAAAELGIDTTPIEGFNPDVLNEVLGLDTKRETTVVLLALGYRDEQEDHLANVPKIRQTLEQLVEKV